MDTSRILAFRHPSQAKLLLESVLQDFGWLPRHAQGLSDRSDLPSVLQRLLIRRAGPKPCWVAWRKDSAVWFFTAEVIPAPPGNARRSALKISGYDERGRLTTCGVWVHVPPRGWQRCAL